MKQYVCSICGYVHDEAVSGKWEDLPADWKCPLCGAGKDAFKPKEEKTTSQKILEKPHVDKELSPMEMGVLFWIESRDQLVMWGINILVGLIH